MAIKACMRMFGFDAGVCRKLVEFEESKSAVALATCEVYHLASKCTHLWSCDSAVFGLLISFCFVRLSLLSLP